MTWGSVELCSVYVDFNFDVISIATQCNFGVVVFMMFSCADLSERVSDCYREQDNVRSFFLWMPHVSNKYYYCCCCCCCCCRCRYRYRYRCRCSRFRFRFRWTAIFTTWIWVSWSPMSPNPAPVIEESLWGLIKWSFVGSVFLPKLSKAKHWMNTKHKS